MISIIIPTLNEEKYILKALQSLQEFKRNKLIEIIKRMKITSKKTLFIIHRNKKIVENISKDLIVSKEKNYGLSKIIFGKIY